MKELSVEEKAKRYDEALERTRELYSQHWVEWSDKDIESIFPELKESEDEKIRKEILEVAETVVSRDGTLYGKKYNCREWIAWLKKQVESKEYTFKSLPRLLDMIEPTSKAKAYCRKLIDTLTKEGYNADAKIVEEVLKGWNGEDVPMAVMDEQKPADNFKPKFKDGDWIVFNERTLYIRQVIKGFYRTISKSGLTNIYNWDIDNVARLWTVQDAKDGDVLYFNNDSSGFHSIGLFKRLASKNEINGGTYRCYARYGGFNEESKLEIAQNNNELHHCGTKAYPATKEQRAILFSKMEEAGYEWNAEKKELKKIEQKSINENLTDVGHEYYSKLLSNDDSDNIDDYAYQCAYCMSHDWMKETATWEDVQKAVKLGAEWNERHHNSSWSVEDMSKVQRICKYLDEAKKYYADITEVRECTNWLKSLKDRVQPKQEWSEEDEAHINSIIDYLLDYKLLVYEEDMNVANGVQKELDWLKSLQRMGG